MFASQGSMTAAWVVLMIVFLVVEGIVPGLVSIWFALGSLAALISAMLGAQVWLPALWFVVISLAALAVTRPLAKRYVNARAVRTNADMAIGQDCVVTEAIDNVLGRGAVSVGGKIWTARMSDPYGRAAKGEVLRVLRIEGVKLIVEAKEEPKI